MNDVSPGDETGHYLVCQGTVVLQNIVVIHPLSNGDLFGDGKGVIQVFIGDVGKLFSVIYQIAVEISGRWYPQCGNTHI